ncbi:TPA: hypothetical protein EYP75_02445 [Candidatus Bathyarchaeota archaeon]|nr:hypothetical protein [Candidatus Bathyarchaeota archaeon]
MKQRLFVSVIVCLLIGIVAGYGVGYLSYGDQISRLKSDLNEAQKRISEYKEEIAALNFQISTLESNRSLLEEKIGLLEKELNETTQCLIKLQTEYENLFNATLKSTLRNPTWEELKSFLKQDETDKIEYKLDEFDCTGFAITLRDHARDLSYRCAFVEIAFAEGEGHALNAFQTVDRGLIFVDDTGKDTIAYVQIGQPYGVIGLNAVKSRYIDCSGDPTEFWGPLNYTTHPDPFSYDYYVAYQKRVKFYKASVDAYNEAVKEYNRGGGTYSYSQIQSWYENLEALSEELGILYEPLGTVQSIEMYWN